MKLGKLFGKRAKAPPGRSEGGVKTHPEPQNFSNTEETKMADTPKTQDKSGAAANPAAAASGKQTQSVGMGIRLMPVENSDQPVVANYTSLNVAPGMVFVDFGFLEPAILTALPRVARSGGKLPERLNGKLAVRVALGYDALANLHQQLGQVLRGLGQAQAARAAGAKKDG
jgi:hypothetical protein